MIQGKKALVASTHAADYVWRSGGTIAKYIKNGAGIHMVVLSLGVRGGGSDLRRQERATADSVKEARKKKTMEAAAILGIRDIEFWDLPDYLIVPALMPRVQEHLTRKIREAKPDTTLTHDKNGEDVSNPDHNAVSQFVFECSIQSNSNGVRIEGTQTTKQICLYDFEPHQMELSKFMPGSLIDIAEACEQKVAAMKCFKAQGHLIEYHTRRVFLRDNHIRKISGNQTYKHVECSSNFFPTAGEELYQNRKEIIHI